MNLRNKRILAAKVLKVGTERVIFSRNRLNEIKEAITRQDIKDLFKDGAIRIAEKKGRRKIKKRKTKRGKGTIKKSVKRRKQEYVKITRKLRNYIKELKKQGKIGKEEYAQIRKEIRARAFKSKAQLKEAIGGKNA